MLKKHWKVGIDLAPAGMGARAPGTVRLVSEQARALFRLDLPWQWVPLVESRENPLWEEMAALQPVVVPGRKIWTRATCAVGPAWKRAGCQLGFATAYFVPWSGLPVVANFFDSNLFEYGQTWVQSGRRWNYYLNRTLSRYALERARRLFVLSDYCVQKLEELFPQHRDKFRVTPCGVTAAVAEASERLLWPVQPQTYFLYVGVFSENKNQRRLLEAWGQLQKKYPAWPALVLIGRCDPNYQQEVIAPALRKLPRPAEVILLARVSPAELTWYYRQALAYVQPSIAEGFGLPVIEAMSHGLAVTCSDTTSLPEVAGDAALYFDPFDVGSMVQSLERLGQDENLRNDLRHRGQVRAQTFTWERHASLVAGEIESVLAEIKSRTP